MFNEIYKELFLDELEVTEESKRSYRTIFKSTMKTEKMLNKDLFEMNFKELELVLYKAQYRKINSIINYATFIKNYIEWAKNNELTDKNPINLTLNEELLNKYLYNEGNFYLTLDELMSNLYKLINVQHQALVLCIFEGVRGLRYSEITNLKYQDLLILNDEFYLYLKVSDDEDKFRITKISKELRNLLLKTYHKKDIISINGKKLHIRDGEYIFRKNRSSGESAKITDKVIFTIIRDFVKEVYNRNINANYIYTSGIMHRLNEEMGNDRVLTKEIAEKIIKEYDLGSHIINGKAYPIYKTLRRLIDEDFMKQKYGNFIMQI